MKKEADAKSEVDPQFLIDEFASKAELYQSYTHALEQLMRDLLASQNIAVLAIEARAKSKESFAEKVQREDKLGKYREVSDLTDLSGLRIIAYLQEDCDSISELIKDNFDVDWANSVDKASDIDDDRFGYLSDHYVVSINSLRLALPEFARFSNLKAEIQVRTVLQHAWAAIDWRFRYKSKSEAPKPVRRRLYRISALLEAADDEFSTVTSSLKSIESEYSLRIGRNDYDIPVNKSSLEEYVEKAPLPKKIAEIAIDSGLNYLPEQDYSASKLLSVCETLGIQTISDLDEILAAALPHSGAVFRAFRESRLKLSGHPGNNSKSALLRTILGAQEEDQSKFEDTLAVYNPTTSWPISARVARDAYQAAMKS